MMTNWDMLAFLQYLSCTIVTKGRYLAELVGVAGPFLRTKPWQKEERHPRFDELDQRILASDLQALLQILEEMEVLEIVPRFRIEQQVSAPHLLNVDRYVLYEGDTQRAEYAPTTRMLALYTVKELLCDFMGNFGVKHEHAVMLVWLSYAARAVQVVRTPDQCFEYIGRILHYEEAMRAQYQLTHFARMLTPTPLRPSAIRLS